MKATLDTNVLVRLATRSDASQAAQALQVKQQATCRLPCPGPRCAGLALLEAGGDFADGAIAYEGELLGGAKFVTFDQQAAKLLKAQKRKMRWLKP
jgi:predicted nucleic-acid-binding protein